MISIEESYNSEGSDQFMILQKTNPLGYAETYTVRYYMGDVRNKDILEMGCGNGFYCRIFKKMGANVVHGVDVIEQQIHLAKQIEAAEPLGCTYQVGDATADIDPIGQFDFVTAIYLLVSANTSEQLTKFCKTLYKNLKPGGRCVAIIRNCLSKEFWGDTTAPYGVTFSMMSKDANGLCQTHNVHFNLPNGKKYTLTDHCLIPEIYEKVFLDVGFSSFEFKNLLVDDKIKPEFPRGYWETYLKNPVQVVIVAVK